MVTTISLEPLPPVLTISSESAEAAEAEASAAASRIATTEEGRDNIAACADVKMWTRSASRAESLCPGLKGKEERRREAVEKTEREREEGRESENRRSASFTSPQPMMVSFISAGKICCSRSNISS